MAGSIRTHGGRAGVTVLVAAASLVVLLLSACSQTSPNPPAAKPGSVPTSSVNAQTPTESAVSTPNPSSAHQGTVSPDDYAAIVAAMKQQGFTFQDETDLLMQYGTDKQHVTVNGTMTQVRHGAGGNKTSSVVEVANENGTWKVISAK
jgi:hypothetical protein